MKQKKPFFSSVVGFCAAAILLFGAVLYVVGRTDAPEQIKSELGGELVSLNRAVQLVSELRTHPNDQTLQKQLDDQMTQLESARRQSGTDGGLMRTAGEVTVLSAGLCIAFALIFYFFLLRRILWPFQKLEDFAGAVAAGDLDAPLRMERENVFGAFSWAFDLMRTELKKARAAETEAKLAQKTLVAAISHDIKTPVASIRAYAEALSAGTATTPERQARYLAVIQRKADEVAALTDDLFLHAVSDLDKLSIKAKDCAAPVLMEEILAPFRVQFEGKLLAAAPPNVTIRTDPRRLAQVFENIVANTAKYAPESALHISFDCNGGFLVCSFEDFGGGIPPADLPFVRGKFFRGKNVRGQKGAGLGLYIVDYILQKTGGYLSLENTGHGLLTRVGVRLAAAQG